MTGRFRNACWLLGPVLLMAVLGVFLTRERPVPSGPFQLVTGKLDVVEPSPLNVFRGHKIQVDGQNAHLEGKAEAWITELSAPRLSANYPSGTVEVLKGDKWENLPGYKVEGTINYEGGITIGVPLPDERPAKVEAVRIRMALSPQIMVEVPVIPGSAPGSRVPTQKGLVFMSEAGKAELLYDMPRQVFTPEVWRRGAPWPNPQPNKVSRFTCRQTGPVKPVSAMAKSHFPGPATFNAVEIPLELQKNPESKESMEDSVLVLDYAIQDAQGRVLAKTGSKRIFLMDHGTFWALRSKSFAFLSYDPTLARGPLWVVITFYERGGGWPVTVKIKLR